MQRSKAECFGGKNAVTRIESRQKPTPPQATQQAFGPTSFFHSSLLLLSPTRLPSPFPHQPPATLQHLDAMVVINSAQLAKKYPQLPANDVDKLVNQFR